MEKLVTVVWSVTVKVNLPAETWLDNLDPFSAEYESAVESAWGQVQKNDGEVTDVSY